MSCVVSRGLCDELITRSEESYRLCCVVVCDLETSRMGAPYIHDISHLRVKYVGWEAVDSVHVADIREKWRASVITAMDLSVP